VAQTPPSAGPSAGQAQAMAARARTLAELAEIQSGFDGLEIRLGARNFVFADGNPAARVMILGEAPGEEEDREGRPFVGRAGRLLDQMFDAIGLARDSVDAERALYITNVLPWRPPGNRRPEQSEIDAMLPFVARHVELAAPDFIVLMGNTPCKAALGRDGILRLRGKWTEAFGRPALPMTHPAYLLRNPIAKREAWADLLSLAARLQAGSQP
jgi:uracil-DNA glycosylase family 4